jgi:hypothetical protein
LFREIESTVYTCKICNYTAMSQSDLCRNSMHPVKKIKAKLILTFYDLRWLVLKCSSDVEVIFQLVEG